MNTLSWEEFDGKRFQLFCGSLLLFEVSKFAEVFTAEGKDKGIDQLYDGSYDGKKGKWRFQDKFHNSGNKTKDISAFKRDVVEDIRSNYSNEHFIVFITNVNLTTTKKEEILSSAKAEIKRLAAINCEVFIWHQAHLDSLLIHYPIVHHFFWPKGTILLQSYEEYFRYQLSASNIDSRSQLTNTFFGREELFTALTGFLESPTTTTVAIIANGGYGKTRTVIEFLKQTLCLDDIWIPLFLSHSGFNPHQFEHLLKTKRKFVIIIDNAHDVPEMVSEVKRLIDNSGGKDKLMLTTRPALFGDILLKLPSLNKGIEKLAIEALPPAARKAMFEAELPLLEHRNIVFLTDTSRGIPTVMLELIRLIKKGKNPREISEEADFSQSVKQILNEIINEIETKHQIPKIKTHEFIKVITLLAPLPNDTNSLTYLSNILDLRADHIQLLINEFYAFGLFVSKNILSIAPDTYSDTILADTIKNNKLYIDRIIASIDIELYFENALMNLSEAAISNPDKTLFIDELLGKYLTLISDPETSNKKILHIFEFVEKITYFKPQMSVKAIQLYLLLCKDVSHPLHLEAYSWNGKKYISQIDEIIKKIFYSLCNHTKFSYDNKQAVHALIDEYIRSTKNYGILKACYGFHEWNLCMYGYDPHTCSQRQIFLSTIICKYLNEAKNDDDVSIGLAGAAILLELEFDLENIYERATGSFSFGHAHVPDCIHVQKIRSSVVAALIKLYPTTTNKPVLDSIMTLLLPYFFYASVNHSKRHPQDLTNEIDIVFKFFTSLLSSSPTTIEKSRIKNTIVQYEFAGYRQPFNETVQYLKNKASEYASPRESLEMALRNSNYFDARNNLEPSILYIIDQYSDFGKFEDDLIEIKSTIGASAVHFTSVLRIIGKQFPNNAKTLFNKIQTNHLSLIPEALYLVFGRHRDVLYFDSILDWLWERKDDFAYSFFWILGNTRVMEKEYCKKSDLDYYEYAINNRMSVTFELISSQLIRYAFLDKQRTFHLIDQFIKTENGGIHYHLIFSIFDPESNYTKDYRGELYTLFNDNIGKIDLQDLEDNQILSFIDSEFGFDELLKFVNKKIEVELHDQKKGWYHLEKCLPYKNKNLSEQENINRFINVLASKISNPLQDEIIDDYVVSFFKPSSFITDELYEAIAILISKTATDLGQLTSLARFMRQFSFQSETWLDILCKITEQISALSSESVDVPSIFGDGFTYNLGLKSKGGKGQPCVEDSQRKIFLEKVIAENKYSDQVMNYIKYCLVKVRNDIAEAIKEDEI